MPQRFGFRVLKRLGGGRFSDVYEVGDAQQPLSAKRYALKVVELDAERPPHNARNEVSIMGKLKIHKGEGYSVNVVKLLAEFTNPMEIGLMLPLYKAALHDVVSHHCRVRTRFNLDGSTSKVVRNELTVDDIRHLVVGLLDGLAFIHSCGIIHRDIHPSNIMFKDIDSLDPVIIDFGISYDEPDNNGLEAPELKFTDIATGYYKAPELLLSVRNYGTGVDVWSMAIVMALLCSEGGTTPFDKDAAHSDLALLSNIVRVFGSPPKDWEDCKGSRSFAAMNEHFFASEPLPIDKVLPKVATVDKRMVKVFRGMTKYPSKERWSAIEARKGLIDPEEH
ncbi:DEKNAAC100944 [Brettanomyces naardenensis]|uniref:DEKNAAC100944 n=1 Tax=Brettanomyces naardenensis TaxID=13370 RepID=A0A448YGR6_BRENA|nr:DEKNAAC100944 [Brettanomyces naardenensis]